MRAGASELQQLFQSLGQPVSYQKLFNVMEQYDVDKSGQLDFGEFLKMFRCVPSRVYARPRAPHIRSRAELTQ